MKSFRRSFSFFSRRTRNWSASEVSTSAQPYSLSDNWWHKYKIVVPDKKAVYIKDIQSACIRLKQFKNIAELKKIEKLLKDMKDEGELIRLMKLHKLLMEQKKEFARTVGNVVYRPTT